MQLNDLLETRAASLYHATGFANAVQIITDDMFRDKTEHTLPDVGSVKGVSFTRNFRFAFGWSFVTFEVDRIRLAQHYRLHPFNYWQSPEKTSSDARQEAEEFVIGPISKASRYITAIHIGKHRPWDNPSAVAALKGFFDPLSQHPLLKVHS
jgi:hypothetical protein